MTSPWWAAFGPAETTMSCGDLQHLVRWADGALQAVDHAGAEERLGPAAPGGGPAPCLVLVRAWGACSDDLRVLAIGPRSAADTLTLTPRVLGELTSPHTPVPGQGPRPGYGEQEDEPVGAGLLRLLALGPRFQFRLSGAVAHAWSTDGLHAAEQGRARPSLTAALTSRFGAAAAQWLGVNAPMVEVSLHNGAGWGEIESAGTAGGRQLRARLPVSWLARAWAPGLAVVGGHLVVSVQHASWPMARVLGLKAPGADPVELSVRASRRGWTVLT